MLTVSVASYLFLKATVGFLHVNMLHFQSLDHILSSFHLWNFKQQCYCNAKAILPNLLTVYNYQEISSTSELRTSCSLWALMAKAWIRASRRPFSSTASLYCCLTWARSASYCCRLISRRESWKTNTNIAPHITSCEMKVLHVFLGLYHLYCGNKDDLLENLSTKHVTYSCTIRSYIAHKILLRFYNIDTSTGKSKF